MVNQQQAKWVVPNPQIPRSFGLMNIIFGAIMLLVGAGYLAMYVISPTFTKQMQAGIKKQQADQKAEHETKLAELKQQGGSREDRRGEGCGSRRSARLSRRTSRRT